MTHFEAYLLTRLDSVIGLGFITLLLGGAGVILCIMMCGIAVPPHEATLESISKDKANLKKISRYTISLLLCGSIIFTFIPTTKEVAFIYIAPAIINNQHLQETMEKLPNISKLGLEYIEETLKDNINNK